MSILSGSGTLTVAGQTVTVTPGKQAPLLAYVMVSGHVAATAFQIEASPDGNTWSSVAAEIVGGVGSGIATPGEITLPDGVTRLYLVRLYEQQVRVRLTSIPSGSMAVLITVPVMTWSQVVRPSLGLYAPESFPGNQGFRDRRLVAPEVPRVPGAAL